ncbi:MAG: methionine aminotransferase [Ignavibacteria bacterium]|nr:methionine aminotransferase [Ignavibacteria bacterium]
MKEFSKIPGIGESIFAVMSRMAVENNAINLSQGFPDFSLDTALIELVHKYMLAGNNQYAPMPGVLPLREAICDKISALYGSSYSPAEEVTITAGATQALYTVISTFIRPGDEVIIFEPAYDSYVPSVIANGGIPVPVILRYPDFAIPWDEVKDKITANTRMIIINSPHNPTGVVYSEEDYNQLAALVNGKNIVVMSDEVYEHLVFDELKHTSLLSFKEKIPNSVTVFSFGKVFHATGWKVGYIIANSMLTTEIRKIHQFTVFAVNTPVQFAYAEYLKNQEHYLSLNSFFENKRNQFNNLLSPSKYHLIPSKGTYFQLLDYSALSNLPDYTFSEILTKKFKVATIPLSAFYSTPPEQTLIRICFAKTENTIINGAQKLLTASEEFSLST